MARDVGLLILVTPGKPGRVSVLLAAVDAAEICPRTLVVKIRLVPWRGRVVCLDVLGRGQVELVLSRNLDVLHGRLSFCFYLW